MADDEKAVDKALDKLPEEMRKVAPEMQYVGADRDGGQVFKSGDSIVESLVKFKEAAPSCDVTYAGRRPDESGALTDHFTISACWDPKDYAKLGLTPPDPKAQPATPAQPKTKAPTAPSEDYQLNKFSSNGYSSSSAPTPPPKKPTTPTAWGR